METADKYVRFVYVDGALKYQFPESCWYATATPAQGCIKELQRIKAELPKALVIRSFGTEYRITDAAGFVEWVKHVFSPTALPSYQCDFSQYL